MLELINLIAEHVPSERLYQLERALITLRDCAKEAMVNSRKAKSPMATAICRGAYQSTSHQLRTLQEILKSKEGD